MTAYEVADYFNALPQRGVVAMDSADYAFYFVVTESSVEAISDSTLRITGVIGHSLITLQESSMLIEAEKIEFIRHIPETRL